jgi:hypothetical protein
MYYNCDIKWSYCLQRLAAFIENIRQCLIVCARIGLLLSLWSYLFTFRHGVFLITRGFLNYKMHTFASTVISYNVSLYFLIQPITLNFNNLTGQSTIIAWSIYVAAIRLSRAQTFANSPPSPYYCRPLPFLFSFYLLGDQHFQNIVSLQIGWKLQKL